MDRVWAVLVLVDLVDSVKITRKLGDVRTARAMVIYDRIFRGLLIKHDGIEIDKTDGALLLFERLKQARAYVEEYHRLIEAHTPFFSRAGIHCDYVIMRSNHPTFVGRGAKPIELDGLAKSALARLTSLGGPSTTVLSKRAGESLMSMGGDVRDGGKWKVKGLAGTLQLFTLGAGELIPTLKAKLYTPPRLSARERLKKWALRLLILGGIWGSVGWLIMLENLGVIPRLGLSFLFSRFF